MSGTSVRSKKQLYRNPLAARFIGLELILLAIASINLFIIKGSFGYLFYGMTICLAILVMIVGLTILISVVFLKQNK